MKNDTIYDVCHAVNNWFADKKIIGEIKIEDGTLSVDTEGYKYIRIINSKLNDGVYDVTAMELTDEDFDGAVWLLKLPRPFLTLCERIELWQTANEGKELFQSESFGGYSYSRAADATSWQGIFRNDLDGWRKKR